LRQHLAQYLRPLWRKLWGARDKSGKISTGSGKVCDQSKFDNVTHPCTDDWNKRRCTLSGLHTNRSSRKDDIHVAVNEIPRQFRKPSHITLGPSIFDCDVLSFNVTQGLEAISKSSQGKSIFCRRAGYQPSHPRYACRWLLRARRERPRHRRAAERG
jgi:hypothetical protein